MISMDNCSEGDYMGNTELNCGYIFHCPLLSDGNLQELLVLPLAGCLILPSVLPKVDELTHFIFHPPKNRIINPNS
jgi:hypothetical protein